MAKAKPDCNNIKSAHCHHGRSRKRDVRECFAGDAYQAIGELTPGCEIFGFNKGQFSLMDVIVAILDQTGPARVDISTWTAANADIRHAFKFVESGRIESARWVIDRSFPTRQPEYFRALVQRFGADSVRLTRTHAKFCLIRNDKWNIVLRSSMNLNKNPRFENFEISDDPAFADYFEQIVDEIFTAPDVAEMPTTNQVDAHFGQIAVKGECYPSLDMTLRATDFTL